jgi:hypothetical protein
MPLWWYEDSKRWAFIAGAAVLVVGALIAAFLMTRPVEAGEEPYVSVELVGIDRSASQDSEAIAARWDTEIQAISQRAADCPGKALVVVESVYDMPGAGDVVEVAFDPNDGPNPYIQEQHRALATLKVDEAIDTMVHKPAKGALT